MEAEQYVSLEEIEEYNSVANHTFRSEEDFFEFYNNYANHKGFSVRKDNVRYKAGTDEVKWRRYVCSCEGYRELKHFERTDQKKEPRALTRYGCMARLDVERNEGSGIWFVKAFVAVRTHALAKREYTFVLRSHRGMNDPQKAEAIELGLGGLRPYQIMDVMETTHGGPGETGFLSQDLYNFFSRNKKGKIEGSDAEFVLNHLCHMEEKDPEFFFTYSTDNHGRLRNLFWSDAQSQTDNGAFGDVVVFDSTYRVNRYNLPFVPFIGVNHHRSTVVFGCGIISDETIPSYVWLLEALLEAMHQRHPKSLITDGDAAMARAIEIVMPNADHRLCSWHIEQNVLKRLRGSKQKRKDFRKFIYRAMEVDEFERRWKEFRANHKIKEDNFWVNMMYELRRKWAAAYTRGRHFLGMQSNQRSESLNSRGTATRRPEVEQLLQGLQNRLERLGELKLIKKHQWKNLNVKQWRIVECIKRKMQYDGWSCGLFTMKFIELWTGNRLSTIFTQAQGGRHIV